jgi:hypothetical protein
VSQARTPIGAPNIARLALRSPPHGESDAGALYHMPDAAGSLRPCGQGREELESQAWVSTSRLALRGQTHGEPDTHAVHKVFEAAEFVKSEKASCPGESNPKINDEVATSYRDPGFSWHRER